MADAKRKWVAYTDLGAGPGAFVDPEALGGEDSDNFKYLVDHRVVVPLGDPDAAIAMGTPAAQAAIAVDEEARNQEVQALKDRIAELEAAAKQHQSNVKEAEKAAAPAPSTPAPSKAASSKTG